MRFFRPSFQAAIFATSQVLIFASLIGFSLCGAGAAPAVDFSKLPAPAQRPVDFVKDIQPIFEKACYSCHGLEKQKGGYRLDAKVPAFTSGDEHAPNIVAGKSLSSPLIHFVGGLVDDMLMPAKGERLTAEQIGLLRAWIDQGAVWPENADKVKITDKFDWWSLKPVQKPSVPQLRGKDIQWAHNPIDAFILAKQHEKGLSFSPPADRYTLIRRVYFDLIGLPPTPEEVEAFVASPDSQAYEKLVDHLLDSPQYGERWARHWLDVVHYGDTHGYDKDKPRPNAWPYRDYVIRAFNNDKPYSRFVQEQLAGDALFPDTEDGNTALGFIAAGPWDFISHAEVPETKYDGKVARNLDRDDMVSNTMNTFCSATVQCARCHNHKFDPISQENYYELQAVFAALDRADKPYDIDPGIAQKRTELTARKSELKQKQTAIEEKLKQFGGETLAEFDRQIAPLSKAEAAKKKDPVARPDVYPQYGYHSKIEATADQIKWVQVDLGESVKMDHVTYVACYDDFNNIGAGFGFPVRFKIEVSDDADFKIGVTVIEDRTAEDVPNPGTVPHTVKLTDKSGRYIRFTATKLALRKQDYIFALAELSVFDAMGKNVAFGKPVSSLDSIEAGDRWRKTNLVDGLFPKTVIQGDSEALAQLRQQRSAWLDKVTDAQTKAENAAVQREQTEVNQQLGQLPPPKLVYAGMVYSGSGNFRGTGPDGGKPRAIHILARGDVRNPGKEVVPGTVPFIRGVASEFKVPASESENLRRVALARWITDERNPLTWRTIVNRLWLYHFGRAIVDSPNDFGRMGQQPTHPELLDWLAADFRDHGQSLKRLHRLIVTSATYRQSSQSNETFEKIDANNAYLWRMNRRKLEAEAVHDSVLMVAGQLDLKMGGPGFQDFVVERPEHSPHYEYQLHDPEDPKAHRRSIYRFIVRSQPQPFMTTLDCADPSMSVEKRNETVNALQALALMNNKLTVAMAKHFAERVEKLASEPDKQVRVAYKLALGRDPLPDELQKLTDYTKQYGLANTCRVILNLNEFSFVD